MIYLDHNATTPVDPEVLEAMLPWLRERFGNAASGQHEAGRSAARAVDRAREQVAAVLGADPREIVWTSGATESDNLALKGVAEAAAYRGRKKIVTVRTEHKAVLDCCDHLERRGYRIIYLPVGQDGLVDLRQLADSLDDDTLLVSVMHANNETGVLHPIAEIGALCRDRGVLFHTDAAQSVGREPIDVERDAIDLLSLSGHKMYGPQGIGALYVRRRRPRVRCAAQIHGGGHQGGLRSGTLNVPGIVGLGAAAALARRQEAEERRRLGALRDRLEGALLARVPGTQINGRAARRLSNTTSVSFVGRSAERMMERMPEVAVSTSAACSSASRIPSYVLGAMELPQSAIRGSLRISTGRFTTEEEIDRTVAALVRAAAEAEKPGPDPGAG